MPSRPQLTSEEFASQIARISAEAQRASYAERQRLAQARANALFARSAMPVIFSRADLDKPFPAQAQQFEYARAYVSEFAHRAYDGAGVVIHGSGTMAKPADVGTGKSHLLCAIGNALIAAGRSVMYCTAGEMVQRVRHTYAQGNGTEWQVLEALTAPDALLIDELGVQSDTDFEQRVLENVMDGRLRQGRPTLFATNLSPEAIKKLVGVRVFDRMREGDFLPMCGASLRGRR